MRFFGGWEYSKKLVDDKDFVKKAYKGGVPMGGDLPKKASKAPTFAVWASKDPESVNAVWTDPDFDPDQKAVYHVRVLEIPTARWSTHDSARNNLPLSKDVPATPQERAWSSPIWYTPEAMKTATK